MPDREPVERHLVPAQHRLARQSDPRRRREVEPHPVEGRVREGQFAPQQARHRKLEASVVGGQHRVGLRRAASREIGEAQPRTRQQFERDLTPHPHRQAERVGQLLLQHAALLRPVDERRSHQRRGQDQDQEFGQNCQTFAQRRFALRGWGCLGQVPPRRAWTSGPNMGRERATGDRRTILDFVAAG